MVAGRELHTAPSAPSPWKGGNVEPVVSLLAGAFGIMGLRNLIHISYKSRARPAACNWVLELLVVIEPSPDPPRIAFI